MRREPRTGLLWFGVLAAPLSWAVQLALDYMYEEWIACTPAARHPGVIWRLPTTTWTVLTNAVFLVVVAAALATSLQCQRELARADPTPGRRARFMATAGIINSVVFGIPIALALVPALVLQRCQLSP